MESSPQSSNRMENSVQPEFYFSILNTVRYVRVVNDDGSESRYIVGMRGRDLEDGTHRYQAIGGGALINPEMAEALKNRFGDSIRFREGKDEGDARFYVTCPDNLNIERTNSPEERDAIAAACNAFAAEILEPFTHSDGRAAEVTMARELREELAMEVHQGSSEPVLNESDVEEIESEYVTAVSPREWSDTSSDTVRDVGQAGYHRVFHLHDITMPVRVFDRMKFSPSIRVLSESDVEALRSARQEGNSAALSNDGVYLAENLLFDTEAL